jgi:hypothetical protein
MRHRKRPLSLLIIGMLSLITLAGFIYFFPPETIITFPGLVTYIPLSFVQYIHIPPLSLFFLLFAIFLFSLGSYIFKNKIHGILIAIFVVTYFIFRLNRLTNLFFLLLLLALFVTLELFVSNKKE